MWYLFALLSSTEGLTCPTYTCGTSASTTGQCQVFNGGSYQVTPCETGLICPETTGQTTSCSNIPANSRYPGEYCQSDLDCMLTATCKGTVCIAAGACATSADCNAGFYCLETVCTAQLDYKATCTTDDQCSNDATCDGEICVKMFSLLPNAPTISIKGSLAVSCVSGFAALTGTVYNCAVAPQSVSINGPTVCPETGECTSKVGGYTKACQCGYSGNAYCPLFEGDPYVASMITAWQALFTYSMNHCNGMHRYSYECFYAIGGAAYSSYLAWAVNATLYLDGNWYKEINAPTCIQNSFLLDYENINMDYQSVTNGYSKCPVYEAKDGEWTANLQCTYYSKDIYSSTVLQIYQYASCPTGYTCPGTMNANSTCTNAVSLRNPGDYCTTAAECYTNQCKSHRCVGAVAGGACGTTTALCAPGFYCATNNTCVNVNSNSACAADSQCNSSSTCLFENCVLRYSQVNGAKTELTVGSTFGYSEACQSGFAYTNAQSVVVCGPAPVSPTAASLPISCMAGTTCSDSTSVYKNNCQCGLSGNAYCPLYVGDNNYFTQMMTYSKKLAAKVSCYNNIISSLCVMYDSTQLYNYYMYYTNMQNMLNMPNYNKAVDGVLEIFAAEYYTAVQYIDNEASSSSFGFNLVVAGVGLLVLA